VNRANPSFSIITPVFNGEEFIEETIKSVLKFAPDGDFEYLVIDDGSTDSTSSIVERYRDSIILITQPNMGEAAAVNRGLSAASGSYALVVSADDPLIAAELFSESKSLLDKNPEIVVTYPDWYLINESGEIQKEVNTPDYSEYVLIGLNKCIPGPGAIFRTSKARLIQGRNCELIFGSDYDFWLRLSNYGNFQRIPSYLAQWRSHGNSTSIKSRGPEMAKERIEIIENFLSSTELSDNLKRVALGNAYYSAAILRYFDKNVPYKMYLWHAFCLRRGCIENSKIRELIYLVTLPISEVLWRKLRSMKNVQLNK
jgi:glycosyltransferase involved in cell wall biosynthesis